MTPPADRHVRGTLRRMRAVPSWLPRAPSARRARATPRRVGGCLLSVTVVVSLGAYAFYGGGNWTVVFDGYGSVRRTVAAGRLVHELAPAAARRPDETHAALVVSTRTYGDLRLSLDVRTASQLRTGSPPNPWEAAWALWHYTDEHHFYYLVLKPNGWELGKRHPAGAGGQRFLASGESPAFPLGGWHHVEVVQAGPTMTVRVDGRLLTRFTDTDDPYLGGRVGMYVEDAVAQFAAVHADPVAGGADPVRA